MGADTLLTDTDALIKSGHVIKIIKCKDGSLAGAAGDSWACMEFLTWAEAGRKRRPKKRIFKHMVGLVLTKKGKMLLYEAPLPDTIVDDFYAIGCAEGIARGRRVGGGSVLECVEAAIHVSLACGGDPMILELDK
jgi:hypothetical protein